MVKQLLTEAPEKAKLSGAYRVSSSDSAQSYQRSVQPISQLQRTLGNRDVARLIQAKRLSPSGEIMGLQRKLTVGAADDQYEQEADQVARQVMSMPDTAVANPMQRTTSPEDDQEMLQTKPLVTSITPFVQREMSNEEDKETPVQAKLASVQREISPEEDKGILVQTKLATEISRKFLQRQLEPIEEEEEPIQAKSAGSMSDSFEAGDDVESQINQSKGLGSPLPDPVRSYMEPRFGVDFSGVRVHTGNDAVQMNRNVGAQAFTHGSDIYFGEGRSPSNLELTAHELTHAVQQSNASVLSKERIQKRGESGGSSSEGESSETTEERLDEIERIYRAMIAKARSDGYDVAADNLERFLAGTGGTSILEVGWLRGFDDVIDAERTNQSRFESSLSDRAAELADGSSRSFNDHWDRRLTASVLDELYYASGTSTITSTGSFTLSRSGNEVSITGSVNHRWWDPYDWHAGLSAYIPGFGSISDSDALLLKEHRGAASFDMESTWEQSVQGTVTVRDYWFDSSSYDWSEP